jgi:protein-S-isoprenylcysteine O-methyltransferase Ste14
MTMRRALTVYSLLAVYITIERALRQGQAATSLEERPTDQGSTRTIGRALAVTGLALALAPLLNRRRIALLPAYRQLYQLGLSAMLSGLTVRSWANRVLGAAYTRTLRVDAEQRIVQDGPYRLVRHPGYLGTLLVWLGAALALGNGVSLAVSGTMLLRAYRRRIGAEERMLRDAFGEEYERYASRTWRLVPGLY